MVLSLGNSSRIKSGGRSGKIASERIKNSAIKHADKREELEKEKEVFSTDLHAEKSAMSLLLKNSKGNFLVDINDIEAHPKNSSIYGVMVSPGLQQSMLENGLIDPLVVCRGTKKTYRVLSGHSRLKVLLDPDFQNQKEDFESKVLVRDLGEINDHDQMRLLLEFNLYRKKTWIQSMLEAETEEQILAEEASLRSKSGKSSGEKIGRVADEIAEKYFGKKRDWYNQSKKLLKLIQKDEHKVPVEEHPVVVSLNESQITVSAALKRYEKKNGEINRETRIDKGITPDQVRDFSKRFAKMRYDIEKVSKDDLPCAYRFFNSMAREAKAKFLNEEGS